MPNHPRQFQQDVADRQALSRDVLRADADPDDRQGPGPATHEALRAPYGATPAREGLVPVSNLSISSWYAISGTAMA